MNPLQIPQNTTNAGATLELFVNQQKNEKKNCNFKAINGSCNESTNFIRDQIF